MVESRMQSRSETENIDLRRENVALRELLVFIRDEIVFGNQKHVERINDVLDKKTEQKGS